MPVNTRQAVRINGVTYPSKTKAEVELRLSTGTLSKKLKMRKLPCTLKCKGKEYFVEKVPADDVQT